MHAPVQHRPGQWQGLTELVTEVRPWPFIGQVVPRVA